MLAKYVPGGVWTPAARVVAMRRHGITATPAVLSSIALEAGLSALAGVLVFVISLPTVDGVDAPLWPLLAFAVVVAVLLHPRIFRPLARRLLKPFGASELPPLRVHDAARADLVLRRHVGLRRLAILFLIRSLGGDVGYERGALPRRRGRRRSDRRGAERDRPVGPGRARGLHVRIDACGDDEPRSRSAPRC